MLTKSKELREIVDGLSAEQKSISPKYFYDERGSQLFDEITRLPEYYLTDTEIDIMRDNIDEIVGLVGKQAGLIEFGAGSGVKTRILLEHLSELAAYVPVDISEDFLLESAGAIQDDYPHIDVRPVVADFTKPFALPSPMVTPIRNVVYFPGSTIGNFEHDDAMKLLRAMHQVAGAGGSLLIGVDLQKDPGIIHDAYNDSAGVTAEFNLNMLTHLNRDYGATFDVDEFEHRARYDQDEGRVEISLVSQADQVVEIGDAEFEIADGEEILTEYSHKYTLEGFETMANAAGFSVVRVWTDAEQLFSVQLLTRD